MRLLALPALVLLAACRESTAPDFTGTCRSVQTTAQQVQSNKQTTIVFDTPNCFTADQGIMTLPQGTWSVQAQVTWAPNPQGMRGACLMVNGIIYNEAGQNAVAGNAGTVNTVTATVISDGSTQIRITGTHTSGATLATMVGKIPTNVLTYIQVTRVK